MKKTYLLTPGPTPIPEPVLSALGKQIIHHRTPQFQALFEEVRAGLKYLFQTKQDVITLACTGTGAMDAAVSNLFKKGDTVITINGGKFGERWTKITQTYGLKAIELKLERGAPLEISELEKTVSANPGAKAILFQASETSTGTQMPTKEICQVAKQAKMLSVCDAITACGVFDLPMDEWGIDVLLTGGQKALMLPPGLAAIALSDRATLSTPFRTIARLKFPSRKYKNSPVAQW